MKTIMAAFFIAILSIPTVLAQNPTFNQNFLLGEDSETIDGSNSSPELLYHDKNKDISDAQNQARHLLMQAPTKLPTIKIPTNKKTAKTINQKTKATNVFSVEKLSEAPFGLFWGATQAETLSQGVVLTPIDLKDYENSFSATSLPKPLDFFNRVSIVFGVNDELYRILSYSQPINDEGSAQKTLDEYNKYSKLLEKKYGNKQIFFTPAIIEKTIKNKRNEDEIIKEEAPIGNPNFFNQLLSGNAVLYSTYNNQNVAVVLSIGVDGEKKSYIVIDYKNLKILQKQENATLDAL